MFRNAAVSPVEQALRTHQHRVAHWSDNIPPDRAHGPCDPRDYSCHKEWLDASNLSNYIEDARNKNPGAGGVVADNHGPTARRLAADFLADQDTTDRQELLIRAQRHAETQTSTWPLQTSRTAVRAFLASVGEMIPRPRRQASNRAESFEDFPDVLMY